MPAPRKILQSVIHTRDIAGGRDVELTFRLDGAHEVPARLLLPNANAPTPGAVLLHGYSSRKEDMVRFVGLPLLAAGIATLCIDLPLHGSRADPVQAQAARNPLALFTTWKQGLADARLALRYLGARREVDAAQLALVGYSMGAFLAVSLAADDAAVKALVLAAGGDLPDGTPLATVARMAVDPITAVRSYAGRPLLMLHGRQDRTVLPAQAERLYDAAAEPRELKWWDAGHYLPAEASDYAAAWLRARLVAPARPV